MTIIGRGAFGEVMHSFHSPFDAFMDVSCMIHISLMNALRKLSFLVVNTGNFYNFRSGNMFSTCVCCLLQFIVHTDILQVRLCREKATSNVYAMKKLKKSEMLRRGQVLCDVKPSNSSRLSSSFSFSNVLFLG